MAEFFHVTTRPTGGPNESGLSGENWFFLNARKSLDLGERLLDIVCNLTALLDSRLIEIGY
jgi:hypothetical protein